MHHSLFIKELIYKTNTVKITNYDKRSKKWNNESGSVEHMPGKSSFNKLLLDDNNSLRYVLFPLNIFQLLACKSCLYIFCVYLTLIALANWEITKLLAGDRLTTPIAFA